MATTVFSCCVIDPPTVLTTMKGVQRIIKLGLAFFCEGEFHGKVVEGVVRSKTIRKPEAFLCSRHGINSDYI